MSVENEIEEGDVDCREGIHYIYTGETHELLLRLYPCTLNRIRDADLIEVREEGDARLHEFTTQLKKERHAALFIQLYPGTILKT